MQENELENDIINNESAQSMPEEQINPIIADEKSETALNDTEPNKIEILEAEIQEQKNKYIRLLAEFENYKRRTSKERIDLISSASKDVLISFLDVLDDCERAEKNLIPTNMPDNSQLDGILLVFNKFKKVMYSNGIKAMEEKGKDFDVEKHEAITEIEATLDMKGKVVDELIKGYYLHDKIIRYAKVVIGK